MEFNIWLAFVAASTALLIIPGPTILLVLSYALSQGRQVALATTGGVALGDFIAMTASLMGLGTLVLTSAELYIGLKWIGAAYLIYLGIRLFRNVSPTSLSGIGVNVILPARGVFSHAATVTALNPKSIVFFIAFVPQFIILIATFISLAAMNALAYALMADRMRPCIERPSIIVGLSRFGGCALIAMGIMTATFRRISA